MKLPQLVAGSSVGLSVRYLFLCACLRTAFLADSVSTIFAEDKTLCTVLVLPRNLITVAVAITSLQRLFVPAVADLPF